MKVIMRGDYGAARATGCHKVEDVFAAQLEAFSAREEAVTMEASTQRGRLAYGRWRQRADGRKILCRHYGRAKRRAK